MRNSDITRSLPPAVQRVSSNLKFFGMIGFWIQLVLGIISAVILVIASFSLLAGQNTNPGSGFGIFSAIGGLVGLTMSIFLFFRFMKMSKKLRLPDASLRPKRADTIKMIELALIFNLVGMFLSIMGAEAFLGLVVGKSLALSARVIGSDSSEFVNSTDLLIIFANTHTILAHFTGISSSLLLLKSISK